MKDGKAQIGHASGAFDPLVGERHPLLEKIEFSALSDLAALVATAQSQGLATPGEIAALIVAWIEARLEHIEDLRGIMRSHTHIVSTTRETQDRREAIIDFARVLGASFKEIARDRRAFNRWFDLDAVQMRATRKIAEEEWRVHLGLRRLGSVAALALAGSDDPRRSWRRLGIDALIARFDSYSGDARLRRAAIDCQAETLAGLPAGLRAPLVDEPMLRRVQRLALDRHAPVGLQTAAADALFVIDPEGLSSVIEKRLSRPATGDDFWVRRHLARRVMTDFRESAAFETLLLAIQNDSSAAVRQAIGLDRGVGADTQIDAAINRLITDDPDICVRIAALSAVPDWAQPLAALALQSCLQTDPDYTVRRFALTRVAQEALRLGATGNATDWATRFLPVLEDLHDGAEYLPMRRWAAETREVVWCAADSDAFALLTHLRAAAIGLREGDRRRVSGLRAALKGHPERVGRVLSILSRDDFGLHLQETTLGRPRLYRGERFVLRSWRLIHELLTPSSDKRQAHSHLQGRLYAGTLSAPGRGLAELAETKVPGEPLFDDNELGWRPYLPLPDHAISAIDIGQSVRIFSPEGVTELSPPRGPISKLISRWRLSFGFARVAALRNWTEGSSRPANAYVLALRQLGFSLKLTPHAGTRADPKAARFFVLLPFDPAIFERIETYFYSVYQNSLLHLGLFLTTALSWFLGRHIWIAARLRRVRKAIPLVIGGWGTRGKSGSERLKTALMNAEGFPLISKTTGCEAMFIHGTAFGPLREMFLFRPYDKATIWEQASLMRFARDIGAKVMLWECMGLTPSYVKVLQRHWMRDDISTITNTYPDHEDLQGPAGRDIPKVMTNFIPERGILLTTEEQMRPILADAATGLKTRLIGLGWQEEALLPPEALARFPYDEHPMNIALVLGMAAELGLDADDALREMADRVVPDLGVLKTYPLAHVGTRRVQFVNGMSANERFGAMGNWKRTGFAKEDPFAEPGVFLTTVVNNRADRVPRSRVFARILAEDFQADRHVLIGSNLQGMQGYIDSAWKDHAATLSLWSDKDRRGDPEVAKARFTATAYKMRIAHDPAHILSAARLFSETFQITDAPQDASALITKLEALGEEAKAAARYLARVSEDVTEARAFLDRIATGASPDRLEADWRALLGRWFRRKIVVIEDFHATGEHVVREVVSQAPPGYLNRVMGIQNIKGTGLDFIYRWQAWDACNTACEKAESRDPILSEEGLQELVSFRDFGLLSRDRVNKVIAVGPALTASQSIVGAQLLLIREALTQQLAGLEAKTGSGGSGWSSVLMHAVEGFFDVGDAIRRRRKADLIYRDMVSQRISHDRAASELKLLNARQKGGWLAHAVGQRLRRIKSAWGF